MMLWVVSIWLQFVCLGGSLVMLLLEGNRVYGGEINGLFVVF